MSGRSMRTRTKSARALASEACESDTRRGTPPHGGGGRARSARTPSSQVQKPKYILDSEAANGDTPHSSRSSSRAASPAAISRSSARRKKPSRATARGGTPSGSNAGGLSRSARLSGSNTPVSRASRSSSVTSNGGVSGRRTVPKLKLKTKLSGGRGYNPAAVNYKDSEYHYGSDFEDEEDPMADSAESDKSSDESDEMSGAESDDLKVESDVDLDDIDVHTRPQTPVPFWLRVDDPVPSLTLPPSSDDLPIPAEHILSVFATYEVCRQFHQILRLTPFRIEDFCMALVSEEQSNLLSEVHMALLRTIIRSEDVNSSFGALDQKDSINSIFFFMDSVTWPECMKAFFQSDPVTYAEPLELLNECEYPFGSNEDIMIKRIQILRFLSDQILLTTSARDFILDDGKFSNEEHCRVCHRLGEMLVCDTCPGVYHLGCLEPAMTEVPDEEWRCYLCEANDVEGLSECQGTKLLNACRQEALGCDRQGNRYWFLCRRLVVEMTDGTTKYYSTVKQLEEVSEVLDDEVYEKELWESMEVIRIDMERHMEVTEFITQTKKSSSKKSYFEIENSTIEKIQQEREEMKQKLALEETKMETDVKLEPDEGKSGIQSQTATEDLEKSIGEVKSEEDGKDIGMKIDSNESPEDDKSTIVPIANSSADSTPIKNAPNLKIGEKGDTNKIVAQTGKITNIDGDLRLTRRTLQDINSGTLFFKLGQEGSYKQYVNHYTTNPNALSKAQANEERIKRQHISHKFSLTDVSVFKWLGSLHGTRLMLITTLKQTILQLENNVPTIFMHPNWPLLRKPWIGAVSNSNKPRDFARALTVLQCCMKPCILLPVWSEMLGHTTMKKIPNLQKEEKKRLEKREKQEREAEEERLRPHMTFVKYTLGLKHQVSKQKGEEYRAHGQHGWLWLSSSRSFAPQDARTVGLRAGPFRLAVKYSDIRDGSFKIVLMEPKAFAYLVSKQEEMDKRKKEEEEEKDKKAPKEAKENSPENTGSSSTIATSTLATPSEKPSQEKKRLEDALKHARLETQDQHEALFKEVVDVSAALTNPTRVLYPKVAKKAKVLDEFLNRRLQLKSLEERRIEMKLKQSESSASQSLLSPAQTQEELLVGVETKSKDKLEEADEIVDVEGESDTKTAITSMLAEQEQKNKEDTKSSKLNSFLRESKKNIWAFISTLRDEGKKIEQVGANQNPNHCYSQICSRSKLTCYSFNCPTNKIAALPIVKEGQTLVAKITLAGNEFGLNLETDSRKSECKSISALIDTLQNVVKGLMTKKDELDKDQAMGISTVSAAVSSCATLSTTTNSEIVNNHSGSLQVISTTETVSMTQSKSITTISGASSSSSTTTCSGNSTNGNEPRKSSGTKATEIKDGYTTSKTGSKSVTEVKDGISRVYSSQDTTTKLYLKRIQSVAESKKQSKVVKYPLAPHFYARTRKKRNILLLAKHDVKHLARMAGTALAEGFNYNCKTNNQVWPYPCPRPTFRTAWLYRTACMDSLQAVALQLRVLWACLKWDDIQTRPVSTDGKHQQTTDSAVHTTEITKHRHVGRFSEKTQYFQKKTTIPLDVPKTVVEVTPIRSGLRKRKRAESPQQSEPKTIEQWIDEEKLELWEIRAYRDKIERDKNASITRSRTGVAIKEPQRFEPVAETTVKKKPEGLIGLPGVGEGKSLDDRLKEKNKIANQSPIGQTQTIIRRVTNADGSVTLVRSITTASARTIAPNGVASMINASPASRQPPGIQPGTKKVFISKDGKIIGAQVMPTTPGVTNKQVVVPNSGTTTSLQPTLASHQTTVVASPMSNMGPAQQKVQIVRAGDGKIQVKGLLPGQQLVQMPDGKLQIFSNPASGASSATAGIQLASSPLQTSLTQKPTLPQSLGTCSPLATKVGIQTPPTPSTPTTKPNQIVATYLPPGAPIPSGMSAFISGGKTFCIPKASASLASQGVGAKTTAIISQQAPIMTATASPTIGTSVKPVGVSTPSPSTPKQVVEVKSLGSNTVTFKGNQMIVSGPDVAQAQLIAKQLSSGQAKLAMIGGKQVLISTNTNNSIQTSIVSTGGPTPTLSSVPATPSLPGVTPQTTLPTQVQPIPSVQGELKGDTPQCLQVQVTAQLMQTPQGPRIVLQGIQGSNLPPQDLAIIQQQVKTQLLKAQADAKQQGKVPPTKIVLDLPSNIQSKLQPVAVNKPVTNPAVKNDRKSQVPPSACLPQHPVNGIPQDVPLVSPAAPAGSVVSKPQALVGPPGLGAQVAPSTPTGNAVDGTDHAITKTLASLSPVAPPTIIPQITLPTPPKTTRVRAASGKGSDEKKRQQVLSKINTLVSRQKEMLKSEIARKRALQEKDLQLEIQSEIKRIKLRISEKTATAAATAGSKNDTEHLVDSLLESASQNSSNPSTLAPSTNNHWDEKPCQGLANHGTSSTSSPGSSTLEQSTNLSGKSVTPRVLPTISSKSGSVPSPPSGMISSTLKRKREDSLESEQSSESMANHSTLESGDTSAPMKKRTRTSSVSSAAFAASLVKKDKIYCLCKTKYDPTKFYVGCDICSNWFHGSCVGITKSMSRNMSEFICKDCKKAKEDQEIYCLCKQAYDESQFYIGCERCGDWFHGRCVGILQKESESIDEYLCPNCEPNSPINQANMHTISSQHYEHIGKLLRQVMSNRNSGPFREPVRPKSVPNYYKIVKEPMDLHTIETRVKDQHYERLCEFVGDFMRIFENCRYFNQPNSAIMRSAEALETFFAQKLVLLREKLVQVS